MSDVLECYLASDRQRDALHDGCRLRTVAEHLAEEFGDGPVDLLARTDAALMVAAAVAVLRDGRTSVDRAHVGRTGWEPPEGAVLLEVDAMSQGLRETLSSRYPGLGWLVVPVVDREISRVA